MLQRNLLAGICLALMLGISSASAQVLNPVTPLSDGVPVGAANPLPVSGTFSATLAGFTPNGNFGTLTATASTSASTALPAGAVVAFQNTSTIDVSCVLAAGAATATTNKIVVRGGASVFLTVGANVNAACINQTGSASNVIVMAGGAGLGTNFGGGSGGGGGGGAITAASGSYASGALSAGSIASGAGVDGWDLTQGTKADAPCTLPATTTACSLLATAKAIANAANSAVPAGTNLIGNVGQLYPAGSTPITASTTGTTAATTATLAANATKSTYICGFSIRANATAAATNNATVTGPVTGTLNFTQWTAPTASGLGVTEEVFSPCIISSAVNTAIAVISGAPGTGGVVSVTAWGFQL